MDTVYRERQNEALRNLESLNHEIYDLGMLYRQTLFNILDRIRLFSEAKDFRVAIPDQNTNYTWYF